MAQVKIFEVRDRMTCIPVVAVHLGDNAPQEAKLAQRAGFGSAAIQHEYVLVSPLACGAALHYDPHAWVGSTRTLPTAHRYIIDHFAELPTGAVVDVRWILGEIPQPADSDV